MWNEKFEMFINLNHFTVSSYYLKNVHLICYIQKYYSREKSDKVILIMSQFNLYVNNLT